jgi:hypothetical protein
MDYVESNSESTLLFQLRVPEEKFEMVQKIIFLDSSGLLCEEFPPVQHEPAVSKHSKFHLEFHKKVIEGFVGNVPNKIS